MNSRIRCTFFCNKLNSSSSCASLFLRHSVMNCSCWPCFSSSSFVNTCGDRRRIFFLRRGSGLALGDTSTNWLKFSVSLCVFTRTCGEATFGLRSNPEWCVLTLMRNPRVSLVFFGEKGALIDFLCFFWCLFIIRSSLLNSGDLTFFKVLFSFCSRLSTPSFFLFAWISVSKSLITFRKSFSIRPSSRFGLTASTRHVLYRFTARTSLFSFLPCLRPGLVVCCPSFLFTASGDILDRLRMLCL